MLNGNIYITGFMGAGKSTVGRLLAAALGRRFLELDDLVIRRFRMPIPQAFARLGEEAFRSAETAELEKLSRRQRLVVATGGGAPLRLENRRIMRASGLILNLKASLKVCTGRLGPQDRAERPLWQDQKTMERLFTARQASYADCDLVVNVDGRDPGQVVEAAGGLLFPEEHHTVQLGEASHPLLITWQGPQSLSAYAGGGRTVLLSDRKVGGLHLERYRKALGDPLVLIVPGGEGSKSLPVARSLYQSLLDARIERGDLLVALGGGVVTDLGAFVAATYKRGMRFVLASTSLLGCVDAAVGGKAAVNLGRAKNVVGCFCVPQAVLLDLPALATLPRRQIAEGLVEAYKTGLAREPELAILVEDKLKHLLAGDLPCLAQAARLSALTKTGVVKADFRESGLRRILNLGHTYGHALEGLSRFRISHGRAVAAGLMVAAALSAKRGLIPEGLFDRITKTMRPFAPSQAVWPRANQAWEMMQNDKKNQKGRVMFVLLKGLGQAFWVEDVTPAELGDALALTLGE